MKYSYVGLWSSSTLICSFRLHPYSAVVSEKKCAALSAQMDYTKLFKVIFTITNYSLLYPWCLTYSSPLIHLKIIVYAPKAKCVKALVIEFIMKFLFIHGSVYVYHVHITIYSSAPLSLYPPQRPDHSPYCLAMCVSIYPFSSFSFLFRFPFRWLPFVHPFANLLYCLFILFEIS